MKGNFKTGIAGRLIKGTLAAVSVAFLVAASVPSVWAVPTMTISDGSKKNTVTLTNASGLMSYNGSLGQSSLSLSTAPASGLQMLPSFSLNSLSYSGKGTLTLTIALSDISVHPNDGSISSQISGQTGGTISYSTFGDTSNKLFGNGVLLGSKGALGGSFNATSSATLKTGNPFSLTEIFVVQLRKGVSAQFRATVTDPPNGPVASVPEAGSTLAFLGLAFLGLEVVRRRLTAGRA
jgi:hypothetical protein